MPNKHPPIPKGWRLMRPDETTTCEDMCSGLYETEWEECLGLAYKHMSILISEYSNYAFIRKGEPEPELEKIWMNPWD